MKKAFTCSFLLSVFVMLSAQNCSEADRKQAAATNKLAEEAHRRIGMPGVVNFTEKRLLRQLFELRDQEISTYTYVVDWQGRLFHVCDSIGFGMPFSAQFSNPEKYTGNGGSIPQPEPNGLFPPTSTTATWVICADPAGDFRPVYVEPSIIVSTFPLNGAVRSYTEGTLRAEAAIK
jgi:hypothetical protein